MVRKTGISAIICCYNSAARLEPTLTHLFNQNMCATISWEIILVNNNSTDNTVAKAKELYQQTSKTIPFSIVNESKPGLSYARNKGFETAKYNFALMVDDDNWLCANYVETVFNHLNNNPTCGMVGGLGIAQLEAEEPAWFTNYASCYATGPQATLGVGPVQVANELYGAGCALKLSVLDQIRQLGFSNILSDRTGNNLMSGGDTELCYAFRLAGYNLLYDQQISFKHFLPKGRVNWQYLRRLFNGFGMTQTLMNIYVAAINDKPIPTNNQRFPYWFNRFYFLLTDVLKDARVLIKGYFLPLEGNQQLLPALAKLGQLKSTYLFRHNLIPFHQQVQRFKTNAQKVNKAAKTNDLAPLATVLLPVYNAEKYLTQAIDSVLNQTFSNFQLLIINDGSTDGSLKIIQSYKDNRIRVINLAQNGGLVKALNVGLKEVNTPFIIRTDADDICKQNRFEEQVRFMQQNQHIGACGSWFDNMNNNGEILGGARYKANDETIRLKHLYQIHISHGTTIIRTDVLKKNNISYSSNFNHAEDYDIFDRIGEVSKLANIQQVLYVVRLHNSNVSKTFNQVQKDNSLGVKRRIFKRLGVSNISDEQILMYQELQHQNYKQLNHKAKEVLWLLQHLFNANKQSAAFSQDFFRNHIATIWFHYCNATAKSTTWAMYKSASFVASSDLSFTQKIKFRLKPYFK